MLKRYSQLLLFLAAMTAHAGDGKMAREFDLRKLDPVFERGLSEAWKAFRKKYPEGRLASLGIYFEH
ncbi:MAG: hypothetical protein ACI9DF_005701 [Verrucomicrobiales bacterium]|jgi:hypothetical protein